MNVRDLISKLQDFPDDMEVVITDGFRGNAYHGLFEIKEFDNTVDIGVGGLDQHDDKYWYQSRNKLYFASDADVERDYNDDY